MTTVSGLTITPLDGIEEVVAGADLAHVILDACARSTTALEDGDVVVVASKIVAKAEGRVVMPDDGETVQQARQRLTLEHEVLVETPQVTIVRTPDGLVCANAGIDASNVEEGHLLLLPEDPDVSAARIRSGLASAADVGVVISDTFGRAWRQGQTDVAIGIAGAPALRDERGTLDRGGMRLDVTLIAVADQVAGAADLVRNKAAGVPVVIVRGLHRTGPAGTAGELVRTPSTDLFPHGRGWLARRLATGRGAAVRNGPPEEWEWDLVRQAAPRWRPRGGPLRDRRSVPGRAGRSVPAGPRLRRPGRVRRRSPSVDCDPRRIDRR